MAQSLINLGLYDSKIILPVATYEPGTTTVRLAVQGNSILSSVFIESIDPGATLKVNWWDTSSGSDDGERYDLQGHPLYSGPVSIVTDRQTIVRVHNKPNVECIVTGGNATFGVYATVISSFATDTDASLVAAGQTESVANDRGIPQAILDPATGKWQFASGTNGVQNVSIDGSISTTDLLVTGVQSGATPDAGLMAGSSQTILSFSPSAQIKVPNIVVGGSARGLFQLTVNGQSWATARCTYTTPQVSFQIGTITLQSGDTMAVVATNIAEGGDTASYFAFAYTGT